MAMAALAGGGAVLVVLSTPVALLEMLIASAGVSEMLPAAAPPLGLTARLLIAVFAGLMAIGIAWTVTGTTNRRAPADGRAQGDRKMGFALSKLTALARGRSASTPLAQVAPILRRADAHPDAPARAPIFASRDFGGLDIFTPATPVSRAIAVTPEPEAIMPAASLDMPRAPEPLDEAALPCVPAFARPAVDAALPSRLFAGPGFTPSFAEAPQAQGPAPLPAVAPVMPADPRPLASLSITELTERLERGLHHRGSPSVAAREARVLADMPVATPVPVSPTVEPDVDDALRAALGALRTLAARAG
jgi:hypothetical protein